jgi:hypothetical protein
VSRHFGASTTQSIRPNAHAQSIARVRTQQEISVANRRNARPKQSRFDWGGHKSYVNFIEARTPTKPSPLDVADAAWRAHREPR